MSSGGFPTTTSNSDNSTDSVDSPQPSEPSTPHPTAFVPIASAKIEPSSTRHGTSSSPPTYPQPMYYGHVQPYYHQPTQETHPSYVSQSQHYYPPAAYAPAPTQYDYTSPPSSSSTIPAFQPPGDATPPPSNSSSSPSNAHQKHIVKTEREIQREDALARLEYVGRLEEEGKKYYCIRVWAARKGSVKYYDCDCGRRKAVPNLSKIKRHVQIHEVELHKCDTSRKSVEYENEQDSVKTDEQYPSQQLNEKVSDESQRHVRLSQPSVVSGHVTHPHYPYPPPGYYPYPPHYYPAMPSHPMHPTVYPATQPIYSTHAPMPYAAYPPPRHVHPSQPAGGHVPPLPNQGHDQHHHLNLKSQSD